MIKENKIRSTAPNKETRTFGPRFFVEGGIWFTAFFYKHVTAFRVTNFIDLSNLISKLFEYDTQSSKDLYNLLLVNMRIFVKINFFSDIHADIRKGIDDFIIFKG